VLCLGSRKFVYLQFSLGDYGAEVCVWRAAEIPVLVVERPQHASDTRCMIAWCSSWVLGTAGNKVMTGGEVQVAIREEVEVAAVGDWWRWRWRW
jgi:hypothetical protein